MVQEKSRAPELKKHVATIHSSNKLSLVERKIANALLFHAYNDLLDKDEHKIHIKTLCQLIGYDSKDYKLIKKALVQLLSTVIEWNLIDGNKFNSDSVWNASSIISDASLDGLMCTYSYSNKMKKLLHNPTVYGRLNMEVQARFNSSYGLALYENCIRYQKIDRTPWLEIEKFRKLMGVGDNEYLQFKDFKKRVINKAIDEVNKFSPITVEPKFKKENRQVVSIQFLITTQPEPIVDDSREECNIKELLKEKFGLSQKQTQEVIFAYDESYIQSKINLILNSTSYQNGKIQKLAPYFLQALEQDYQPSKSSQEIKVVNSIEKSASTSSLRIARYKQAYKDFFMEKVLNNFFSLEESSQEDFLKKFEEQIRKGILWKLYEKDKLENILVKDQLVNYLKEEWDEYATNVISFDEFLDQHKGDELCE